MTDPLKTEIAVILDRSGSMASIKKDMEAGFAQFIQEQLARPGRCVLSLYRFDDQYDVVYEERPLARVPPLKIVPRGSTALLDAVGRSVARIGERLSAKPEHERPGSVIVMIITDGRENASIEVQRAALRDTIERQQRIYHWQFVYLGADASTFSEAESLRISAVARFTMDPKGVARLYAASSKSVSEYRERVASGDFQACLSLSDPEQDE